MLITMKHHTHSEIQAKSCLKENPMTQNISSICEVKTDNTDDVCHKMC
jgi:hypothetical protein